MASQPRAHGDQERGRPRVGSAASRVALAIGATGLAASLAGVMIQVLPRQFTSGQQRSITAWELSGRWRTDSAGKIFPASIQYPPPAALNGTPAELSAQRLGIAPQAKCAAGADTPVSAVLKRYGCQAVLRATYADMTDSYVVTVGVAVLPGAEQASAAEGRLAPGARRGSDPPAGVRTVPFRGTASAQFTDPRRQLLGSFTAGPYLVMYAIGYVGDRPRVPVSADQYADEEMTSLGTGVARKVATVLGGNPPAPHCPGAPGC